MHIVQTVSSIEAEAAGPSYSVPRLCRSLANAGHRVDLCSLGDSAHAVDAQYRDRRFTRRGFPYRLGRSPEMYRWLDREVSAGEVDLVHNHGVWMMPNVYPSWATAGRTLPLVFSPRGMFSEWALRRSRLVKFLFWHSLQKRAASSVSLFHATSESEYAAIRRLGFRQPVAIVPNGIDLPEPAPRRPDSDDRLLLFLSRVHPSKGLDMLLRAWVSLQDSHPSWSLQIAGPGESQHVRELQSLAQMLGVRRVTFSGPLYGAEKMQAYRSADLFVLPTHSENFGMVVAEALAAGCPVVTTKGAPWSELVEHGAGWWTDIGTEPLREALQQAMIQTPRALRQMGAKGRAWMERDFSWDSVAARMSAVYSWLLEGGTQPPWVGT